MPGTAGSGSLFLGNQSNEGPITGGSCRLRAGPVEIWVDDLVRNILRQGGLGENGTVQLVLSPTPTSAPDTLRNRGSSSGHGEMEVHGKDMATARMPSSISSVQSNCGEPSTVHRAWVEPQ